MGELAADAALGYILRTNPGDLHAGR